MSRSNSILLLFMLLAATLSILGCGTSQPISTDPNDWPMFNHDAQGTRFNSGETQLSPQTVSGLGVLWTFTTKGDVTATPAVTQQSVFAGDTSGTFYALTDAGKQIWQTQVNGPITASALVTSKAVFFGDQTGNVYALDRSDGHVLWSVRPEQHPKAAIYSSPIWVNGDIVIGVSSNEDSFSAANPGYACCSFRGSVVRLNADTGRVIWQTYLTPQGTNGVSVWSTTTFDPASNKIFVTTGNNYTSPASDTSDAFLALDATSGAILWKHQMVAGDTQTLEADFGDSPQVYTVNGKTVVGAGEKFTGMYSVLSAADGSLVTQYQAVPSCPGSEGLFADSAVANGIVLVNGVNCKSGTNPPLGQVVAMTADAQSSLWQFTTPDDPVLSGVAVANGVAYFESSGLESTVFAADLKTGQILAQVNIAGGISGPSISRGHLYLGTGMKFASGVAGPTGIVALGLK